MTHGSFRHACGTRRAWVCVPGTSTVLRVWVCGGFITIASRYLWLVGLYARHRCGARGPCGLRGDVRGSSIVLCPGDVPQETHLKKLVQHGARCDDVIVQAEYRLRTESCTR